MKLLLKIRYLLWGPFTIVLLLLTGAYLTWKSGFVQFWCAKSLFRQIRTGRKKASSADAITPLQALFTSLGGTLGVGNLAGVAAGIALGGPGAVFYMLVAAFFGMATKFSEIVLAVRFRVWQNGSPLGGPMVYLERAAYHPKLAKLFCLCCIIASLGTGAMMQAGAITEAVTAVVPLSPALISFIIAFAAWPVLRGGSKLIAKTSSILVPFMTLFYLIAGIIVLVLNRERIVPSLWLILSDAARPAAAGGGIVGILTSRCVSDGFSKGIFSNEAGMGSASIAHGCADSRSPCEQGVLGAVEVFLDTCVVCLLTALVILVSGVPIHGTNGLPITTAAFGTAFGGLSASFVCVIVTFLAFSTIIGWSFYGLACLRYLTGTARGEKIYQILVVVSVVLSALFPLDSMLLAADIAAAMMAFPNLIGLWTLAPVVQFECQKYLDRKKPNPLRFGRAHKRSHR